MKFRDFLKENELNGSSGSDFNSSDITGAKPFSKYNGYEILQKKDKSYDTLTFYLVKDGVNIAELTNYEGKIVQKTINIVSAYSSVRGAYKELLMGLLKSSKIMYIFSDSTLSKPAEKFWMKIIKDSSIKKISIDNNDNILEFEEEHFTDPDFRVGITK